MNRDWYAPRQKFPHGMKWLADYIRGKGFRPGIWLIPFATSDEQVLPPASRSVHSPRRRHQRLREKDPKTGKVEPSGCGRYAVDPTSPAGRRGTAICSK